MKITHSLAAKDTIAIARGMYKVVEGGVNSYRANNVEVKIKNSWHDSPLTNMKTQKDTQQQANIPRQEAQKVHRSAPETQQKSSQAPFTPQNKINSSQQVHQQQTQQTQKIVNEFSSTPQQKPSIKQNKPLQKPQIKQKTYKDMLKDVKYSSEVNKNQDKKVVESKVPSSRFSRIFQFTKLGLNIAESAVQAYFTKNQTTDQSATYEKIANRITDQLCKMRGAPLKLAQMLSIQQDKLIPPAIRKAFQKARQTAHILPPEEVLYMMEKNFGSDWRNKFVKFDEKPFASASIGQVHLATLPTQQNVAVKIQYPGVRKSIQSDISNLHLLMKIPGIFPKGMFMERILKNTKQQLTQQCDYILEKQKQEAYEKCLNLCLKKGAELYKVPKVFNDFTTEEIFTSQYLPGVTMKELQESNYPQEIKDEVGRRIMQITFNELFEMGIVQSDPNPSNFTYNFKKDQLNLFDFGATHIYKAKFLQDYFRIIEGSVIQDRQQIFKASIDTGFLTGEQSQAMRENHIESILITGQPLRHKGKYDFGNQKITEKIYKTIPVMLKNRLKHPPEEVYSLHRKLSGSYLACMRLKARIDCSKIWEEIKFQRIVQTIDLGEKTKLVV